MAGIMRIRRTHGILGGVLVALLGIWGALTQPTDRQAWSLFAAKWWCHLSSFTSRALYFMTNVHYASWKYFC